MGFLRGGVNEVILVFSQNKYCIFMSIACLRETTSVLKYP
jgi:hypothetical protein